MQSETGRYSQPRWGVTRWLADAGPGVPDDIRQALIGDLYGSLPVFAAGAVNTVAVSAVIAIREPTAWFITWVILELVICLSRLAVLVAAHRAARERRPTPTDLHLVLAVAWSASVGFGILISLASGDWVVAIGNPFSLGGTVTAGIVSAKNRDISQGPYDSYIQTDAAINRGNSGGPLFNLDGEVIGVNTLIISPTGGSIGLGFAVPSKTVAGVVDQLQKFGELRRGWLGVRIQQVTDEIADSLNIKPARGALVAGVDDKGPAKPAGIEPGDVVVKFDGKDVKDPKDLSRIVADTAVGKEVDVVIIRKGNEETRKVTLGRLEDNDKVQQANAKPKDDTAEKPVTQKALGLDLAALSKDLRTKYKIKDSVKGVVVTGVDNASDAAEKRLSAGDVIVEVAQEAVSSAADIKKRVDQLKKDGKKSVLLLVSNGDGELRFVALGVQ